MTADVKLLPLPEPKFGEWLRGIYASESNPHRDGMYVRTIHRTGKLNPGIHYEVTDGNGTFWQYPAQSVERLATPPADTLGAVRELVQRWVIESNWRSGGVGATYKRCADELESALAQAPAIRVTDEMVRRASDACCVVINPRTGEKAWFAPETDDDIRRMLEVALGQEKATSAQQ